MSFLQKVIIPVDDLEKTVKRFPISIVCAVISFTLSIERVWTYRDDLLPIFALGFFAAGCIRLIAESKGWHRTWEYLLSIIFIGVLFAAKFLPTWDVYAGLLLGFLFLLVMVAPFLSRTRDDFSFWLYNRLVWDGFFLSVLVGLVLAGGIQAASFAVDYLFGLKISDDVAKYVWPFAITIFGPVYGLSRVPEKFEFEEEECPDSARLSFLLNWVLAPLAIVYLLILYAYAAKIAVQMELPKGQLAYMITGFGGIGVLIYLSGWPLREKGTRLLQFLYKHFFKMMILPTLLLAIAIGTRVSAYGITVDRYLVMGTTLWFAVLCALFAFNPRPLKFMVLSLAILLGVAIVGPWGAVPVSIYSQTTRLEKELTENGILVNGKMVPAQTKIPFEAEKDISSIVSYLYTLKVGHKVQDIIGVSMGLSDAQSALKAMGLSFVSPYSQERNDKLYFSAMRDNVLNIAGYKYQTFVSIYSNVDKTPRKIIGNGKDIPDILSHLEENKVIVEIPGKGTLAFALSEPLKRTGEPQLALPVEASNGALRGKILITGMNYTPQVDKQPFVALSVDFTLLLDF